MSRPDVLIEHWLPIEAIGAESKRERGASSALPPLYFLHVWWARRPLIASRAAILASVLPQWSEKWPEKLKKRFPNEETYHEWFIHLAGIRGDPVQGRKLVDWAKIKGIKLKFHPYGGAPRAFTVNPSKDDLKLMGDLLEYTWGTRELSVLDPFAGGGSIPFEALRYGFTTIANELNPVAATILKATLDYPARFGPSLAEDIKKWGNRWAVIVEERLSPYFPKKSNENIFAYLWARTVACPTTGKPVPLSPNWWLSKGSKPVAVEVQTEEWMDEPRFRIVTGEQINEIDPDQGTIKRGVGKSPWGNKETISGDYIKAEAQAGRMGQILYAIATKVPGGFVFRAPTEEDNEAVRGAEAALDKKRMEWTGTDIFPTENIPKGNKTSEPLRYGIYSWEDLFTPRQFFTICTFIDVLREIEKEIRISEEAIKADALITLLAFAVDKAIDRNTVQTRWISQRHVIANTFDRHDFAMKWSFAEFDGAANLLTWSISQIQDAYQGIAELIFPSQASFMDVVNWRTFNNIAIYKSSASDISILPNGSIHNITVDPPYYDNVQYSELSDFFYVWLKRTVGHFHNDFFYGELTSKDEEAVANPFRFQAMGRKKEYLAEQDYERKMAAAFREMHRILTPEGSLGVMLSRI
jgi:putative DNA methylase